MAGECPEWYAYLLDADRLHEPLSAVLADPFLWRLGRVARLAEAGAARGAIAAAINAGTRAPHLRPEYLDDD